MGPGRAGVARRGGRLRLHGAAAADQELRAAQQEVSQLAAERERLRIARDLHDLLGHSLTAVTVKARLAGRLVGRDDARAVEEIGAVERLARQSLADVRAAVAGYREVSLAVELATAREVLAAAGIAADLPRAVDEVPAELRELFGWVVREGVTNAVRHSGASHLRVLVDPYAIEVVDDGRGAAGGQGSGLAGLAERAARPAAGSRPARPPAAATACASRSRLPLAAVGSPPPGAGAAAAGVPSVGRTGDRRARNGCEVIRVLLADDQRLVRGALAALLSLEDGHRGGRRGRPRRRGGGRRSSHRPDVALLDVEMPGLDGVAAAAALRSEVPAVRVAILTTFGRPGYLRRAMEAGALGFVVKDAPAEELAAAIRRVAAGERVVDPTLAAATLAGGASPLTGRERDVLVAARDGATVADIAGRLFLSEGTVRNYLSAAITKTGTRNRVEALRTAERNGWL